MPTKAGAKATGFLYRETGLTTPNPQLNEELRDSYIRTLSALLKENGVKTRQAVLAIPGRSIFSRPLKIPPVSGERLDRIVEFEARQHLPFPLEEVRMEHKAFPSEGGEMDVALLAVKRDALLFFIDILRKCGLAPILVDVSSLALYNTYANSTQKKEEDEVVALVDIGASTSDIVIESRGVLKFMRRARVGGNSITSMLAQEINQSFEEAERVKVRSSEEGLPELTSTSKISEILLRGFERLANDLKNTLDFYVSRPDGLPVNRMYITGGTSRFPTLVAFLEERLGIPVEVLHPFQVKAIDMEAISDERLSDLSAVCIGLALKSAKQAAVDLNFTPEFILEQQALAQRRPALAAQAVLVAGIVGCFMYIADAELDRLAKAESQIAQIADFARKLEGQGRIKAVLMEDELLKNRFSNLAVASEHRGRADRYLLEIGKIKPEQVWIKNISLTRALDHGRGRRPAGRAIRAPSEDLPLFPARQCHQHPVGDPQGDSHRESGGALRRNALHLRGAAAENLKLYDAFNYMPAQPIVQLGIVAADMNNQEPVFRALANAIVLAKAKVEDYAKKAPAMAPGGGGNPTATIETVFVTIYDSVYAPQYDISIPYAKLEELQKQSVDWDSFYQFIQQNRTLRTGR
ncbi:type IV pilus assembly protein PilM [bacterium]|nr:type IV pilus assembly protein PilM [bacterium]